MPLLTPRSSPQGSRVPLWLFVERTSAPTPSRPRRMVFSYTYGCVSSRIRCELGWGARLSRERLSFVSLEHRCGDIPYGNAIRRVMFAHTQFQGAHRGPWPRNSAWRPNNLVPPEWLRGNGCSQSPERDQGDLPHLQSSASRRGAIVSERLPGISF